MRRFVVYLLVASGCLCAQAQQVKVYPRIETGTHSDVVRRIDVDAAERYLVSASDDKTARVWDLRTGKLLKTLRPPIGDGTEGKLYAVAISPDGGEVAVGGFTGKDGSAEYPIYVFDRETGTIRQTISGLPNVTNHLAYAKDGRYLAAALGGKGIRIYKADGYSEVARDEGFGQRSYSVEFDKSGRLVTAAYDGSVRLYSSDFHLLKESKPPGGKEPNSARFSPDGQLVAVGFFDTMAVDVLSASDLSFLYSPQVPAQDGSNLASVGWLGDGKTVCAAGKYDIDDVEQVVCWSDAGKGRLSSFPVAENTVFDIRALRGGAIAFCSGDGTVGVAGSTGAPRWRGAPDLQDYRGTRYPRVSSDGNHVELNPLFLSGASWARHKINFSVSDEGLGIDLRSDSSLKAPVTRGFAVDSWEDSYHPKLDGRPLSLKPYETSRSLAISPNKDGFVLGTDWYIRKFDRRGKPLWSSTAPGVAWGVNITADGRFVVAALGDGTVRWYTFDKGEEVLALFVDRDLQRWVAWNPDGFFTFENGGDALIGYLINHGSDQAGEFVKVDQLREVFYRKDLIDEILKPHGGVRVLAARNRVGDISQILAGGLPPKSSWSRPPKRRQQRSIYLSSG